jgi:glycosyltransferase involved in cell wall biosynthesis
MDVHLVAFSDGVSTRRGTLMAGLAHAVPTLATLGASTDSVLRGADGEALLLAPAGSPESFHDHLRDLIGDLDLRKRIGVGGRELYAREFDWPVLTERFLEALPE